MSFTVEHDKFPICYILTDVGIRMICVHCGGLKKDHTCECGAHPCGIYNCNILIYSQGIYRPYCSEHMDYDIQ